MGRRGGVNAPSLVEDFFRHEYGRLVATLSRRVGLSSIEAVEDAVQSALTKALERWPTQGQPNDPSAWLFRVAYNELVGGFRKEAGRARAAERGRLGLDQPPIEPPPVLGPDEIRDDLLRLLFVCCDDRIPADAQLALALKTLCGFGVSEIAARLFASEAAVYKRLSRARDRLRGDPPVLPELTLQQHEDRLPGVHRVLYLLFTEGHLSVQADLAIRRELCNEAVRLTTLLAEHPVGQTPETHALLALMHLHRARLSARDDGKGGLLLLEEQDRTLWDTNDIAVGMGWLARSSGGSYFSRYHAEAGIAAEHCRAPSFEATDWARIVSCYDLLERETSSPIHTLNRAVATAELESPEAGLALLQEFEAPDWLVSSHMWSAVLADLHRRCGDVSEAVRYRQRALEQAPTEAVRSVLERRLA